MSSRFRPDEIELSTVAQILYASPCQFRHRQYTLCVVQTLF